MTVESETCPLVNIRVATADDATAIAVMHVASWRETYPGLMPATILDGLSVEDRAVRWARILAASAEDSASVFVAEREGDVVGFASGGRQRDERLGAQGFTGEISAMYVLRDAQRRGAGRRLMGAVVLSLHRQGHRAASLWVLRDNEPARRFYENLGGQACGMREEQRGATTFAELAYGWRDLSALACRTTSWRFTSSNEGNNS